MTSPQGSAADPVGRRPARATASWPALPDGGPDGVRLAWGGDLDIASAPVLAAALVVLAELGARRVVVDLCDVTFMDCAGLGVLLEADVRLPDGLHVRGPSAPVRRLLGLAGLAERFATSPESGPATSVLETGAAIDQCRGLVMGSFGCTADQASKMMLSTALRHNVQLQVLASLLVAVASSDLGGLGPDSARAVQRVMGLRVPTV